MTRDRQYSGTRQYLGLTLVPTNSLSAACQECSGCVLSVHNQTSHTVSQMRMCLWTLVNSDRVEHEQRVNTRRLCSSTQSLYTQVHRKLCVWCHWLSWYREVLVLHYWDEWRYDAWSSAVVEVDVSEIYLYTIYGSSELDLCLTWLSWCVVLTTTVLCR